jgi:8-oxo-dGTP diphosphatase
VHPDFVEHDIPVFGARNESLPQKTRACAYAVATTPDGLVAAVHESHGLHLPGGGMELSESPIEAIHREVREELGRRVVLSHRIGQAMKYFESDGYCQALYATFYAAELGELVSNSHEHQLEWVRPDNLFHAHHAWAARKRLASLLQSIPRP